MTGLGETFAHLQFLQRKFENLLAAARSKSLRAKPSPKHGGTRLRRLTAFGSNPGNLHMFVHAPQPLPRQPPLVVALHGCGQSAAEYDQGTGWSTLADQLGFVVVYPEQQPANNPKACFSWFLPGDSARNNGEALSIQQMVEHAIATFGADRRRVFVTGLSAGGAMASVMLATYPEVYAGGAIIAGLPYGSATSVQQAFEAMFAEQAPSARALGDRVRAASKHRGPWPRISVWHGSADPIVKPSNAGHIVRQWTNVHGLSAAAAADDVVCGHKRRRWHDAAGIVLIEAISIKGMAHGVPIATSARGDECGSAGPFFLDVGLSSTHHIARFWGLDEREAYRTVAEGQTHPVQTRTDERRIELDAMADTAQEKEDEASESTNTEQIPLPHFDPNLVIAAAFKAAGLPPPEQPKTWPGAAPHVAPGPIIAAALKAAGLLPE